MSRSLAPKPWKTYEQVSTYLLNMLASELGLTRVEGKQKLPGTSGTEWEVDAKGIRLEGGALVLVECRGTKSRESQAKLAALAYSIQDTGAIAGIIATPIPLQIGAQKVAASAGILHVQIDLNSTSEEFAVKFLNKLFMGIADTVRLTDSCSCAVSRVCQRCGNQFERIEQDAQHCPSCIRGIQPNEPA